MRLDLGGIKRRWKEDHIMHADVDAMLAELERLQENVKQYEREEAEAVATLSIQEAEIAKLTRERDEACDAATTLAKKLAASGDIDTHGPLKAWMGKLKDAEMPSND